MLVADDAFRGMNEIVAGGAQAPAEIDVLSDAAVLAETAEGLEGGAAHQHVAGGDVEGVVAFGLEHQVPAHVERRGDLLVAVEQRFCVIRESAAADSADSVPGEVRREIAEPGGIGHAVAVDEGEEVARRLLGGAVAGVSRAVISVVHQ